MKYDAESPTTTLTIHLQREVHAAIMSGTNVYEIAPIEDRAVELVRYIVSTVPGAQAELSAKFKPHVDARDYATLISEVLDNIDSVFRTGTDEGELRQTPATTAAAASYCIASNHYYCEIHSICFALAPPLPASPADVEGAFTLLFSFLKAVPPARFGQTIDKISTVLTSGPTELGKGAPVRLRTLANLYNVISESTGKAEKVAVFSKLIKFASDTRQLDLLYPYFAHAATWQSKWGISDEQTRRLLLTVSTALEKAGDAEQAQAFLIRYLSTFEGSAASAIDDEALSHAKDAAIGYVKAPAVSQRSALPQFAAVSARPRMSSVWRAMRGAVL